MQTQSVERPTAPAGKSADEIRAWILRELSKELKVDPSTIDCAAPLDSLGVDSLAAIGMTGGLAGFLNRDLPATLMWDYASINAIASGLADPNARALAVPGVVHLQPKGERRPLFFFPGVGGHPVSFIPLAECLGESQPSFGLTVPSLATKETPLNRIEDIVASMLRKLRAVQPKGPYQLAGYSFGGYLAYEAALQLTDAGESVSLLAIYDTNTLECYKPRPRWQRLAIHAYLLARRPGRIRYLLDRVNFYKSNGDAEPEEVAEEVHDPFARHVMAAHHQAILAYRPRNYSGELLLFRAIEKWDHSIFYKPSTNGGWNSLAERVRVHDLPGNHLNLLNTEHASAAAEALRPYLSK